VGGEHPQQRHRGVGVHLPVHLHRLAAGAADDAVERRAGCGGRPYARWSDEQRATAGAWGGHELVRWRPGVVPMSLLKAAMKWLGLDQPHAWAV
jgi:hypothetical protein